MPALRSRALPSKRMRIVVRGAVQGVGFRPFVYRRARSLGLSGWVQNAAEGVILEAEGDTNAIEALIDAIRTAPPPNAVVAAIETEDRPPRGGSGFDIRASALSGTRTVEVPPDLAPCEDCLRELFDPRDRRHLYPFINCTRCGPRYSIIEDMPYDRARTSMRRFEMCAACREEYENPADRRFHAEPIACPACGPRLALRDVRGATVARDHAALLAAADAARHGAIVAVKGVGGFHLIADARDESVVARLRRRKRRPEKPFAVLFPSLAVLGDSCDLSPKEKSLLVSAARPIVLLRRQGDLMAPAVAPGNPWLGALLPYAPLNHLLMQALGFPVVATSGNLGEEPIVTSEAEARVRLGGIADLFLVHDRPIVRPVEDSVVRVVCDRPLMLRRARGYAPLSIAVPDMPSGILALGGHLKTAIALSDSSRVILGSHIGDLDSAPARRVHNQAVADSIRLMDVAPQCVAHDLHPDYATSRAAEDMGCPPIGVPHHLAHVAACMAENGTAMPVLGVAWDGAGYGPDGTLWGGEFLRVAKEGWRRVAHLRPFRLPGGDAAAREPRRSALGLLYEAFGDQAFERTALAAIARFSPSERRVLRAQLAQGIHAPVTSSAGRLFDAFAALCGLAERISYEGQAAAELEWAAEGHETVRWYGFPLIGQGDGAPWVVDWKPALRAALTDLEAGLSAGAVSAAFHGGLARAIAAVARRVGLRSVVLTGGCFQNARLTEQAVAALRQAGFEPVWHERVPPNDGGIALGQAVWAGWAARPGDPRCA